MSERPPERVRVSGPPRRRTGRATLPRRRHIDVETRLGEIYLGSLLREQLRLAALCGLLLALGLGSLPLLFWWQPGLGEVRLFGVPLSWLLIGFAAYPFILLVGWRYVRAAERNERDFAALVESVDPL